MGASCGGVVFRLEPATIDSAKVVHDLFGPGFQPHDAHGDIRYSDYVFIGKTSDLLFILSSDFADKFFQSTDSAAIQKYLDYFSNPAFVFAFEQYDSGGTYSYSLIYDGQVKRQYRMISGEEVTNFGVPEETELKWLNLPTETEQIDEETTELVYIDRQNNYRYYKDQLPATILSALMVGKLGFSSWDMGQHLVEQRTFKRVQQATPAAVIVKKPWWKWW